MTILYWMLPWYMTDSCCTAKTLCLEHPMLNFKYLLIRDLSGRKSGEFFYQYTGFEFKLPVNDSMKKLIFTASHLSIYSYFSQFHDEGKHSLVHIAQ